MFDEVSKLTGEPLRTVQADLPNGTVKLARTFEVWFIAWKWCGQVSDIKTHRDFGI